MRMCVRRIRSPLNTISRCLPADSHFSMVRPTIGVSTLTRSRCAYAVSNRVTTWPARTRCSDRAARNIESPSGIAFFVVALEPQRPPRHAKLQAHRGGRESGFEQELRSPDPRSPGVPLMSSISQPRRPSGARCAIATSSRAIARPMRDRSGSSSGKQTTSWRSPRPIHAAARPFDDHDARTRRCAWLALSERCPSASSRRMGHGISTPYGFAGSVAENVTVTTSSRSSRASRKQIDGARLRELRGAEAGDEVAAPDASGFFEPAQHRIERGEAAGQLLDRRHIARDDAVTREQLMRHRRRPRRWSTRRARAPPSIALRRMAESGGAIETSCRVPGRRVRSGGDEYARSACSVSLVSRPFHTRSQIASTVSCGKPPPAASCSGPKNDAPCAMQVRDDCGFAAGQSFGALAAERIRRQQLREVIGEIQRDAAVAIAERLDADPRHFAGAEQRVEHRRRVVAECARAGFRCRAPMPRSARPAIVRSTSSSPSSPCSRPRQRMPADQEPAERRRFDRLDFLPQPRQRSLANRAQHFGVAPLAPAAAGAELAVDDAAAREQALRARHRSTATPRPRRALTSLLVNGPCVRPKRRTRSTTGSATGSSSVAGRPGGSGTPIASR